MATTFATSLFNNSIATTPFTTFSTTEAATTNVECPNKAQITDQQFRINATVTLLFSFVVIFGNGIIILVFVCDKTVRNLNNKAVILLAITDFLRGR